MNRKYKLALVVFVISLFGMMAIAFKLRGEFGIGTEVVIPVIGILLWLHNDAKKENKRKRPEPELIIAEGFSATSSIRNR